MRKSPLTDQNNHQRIKKKLMEAGASDLYAEFVLYLEGVTLPASREPRVRLEQWSVRRTEYHGTQECFLIGLDATDWSGRRSTPIVRCVPATRTIVTSSGRRYVLEGTPGKDDKAEWYWEKAFGAQPYEDVSRRFLRLFELNAPSPLA